MIVLAILAIHGVVIYFMFSGKKHEEPKEAAPEQQGAVAGTGTEPGKLAPGLPPAPQAKMHESPLFGKPFNYANAVKGNIPAIPDSDKAKSGILVDLGTREVLWAKNPQEPTQIASMTKMMTTLVVFEEMEKSGGKITLDSPVKVSRAAMSIGGSQVYLDPKEIFPLRDLMKAVDIKSANDAAYLVAEFVGGGDVMSFVTKMNERAKELKMPGTTFFNPHGLPGKTAATDNVSSPEGMAILAEHLIDYPQVMEWASTWIADFREKGSKGYVMLTNHNHMVPGGKNECPGVDGLKTGFINRSGFCITVTCKRNNRRLVAVVTGFPSYKERDAFIKKLLDWGYNPQLFKAQAAPAKKAAAPGVAAGTAATKKPATTSQPASKTPPTKPVKTDKAN